MDSSKTNGFSRFEASRVEKSLCMLQAHPILKIDNNFGWIDWFWMGFETQTTLTRYVSTISNTFSIDFDQASKQNYNYYCF